MDTIPPPEVWDMLGERTFDEPIDLPPDVTEGLWKIVGEYVEEGKDDLKDYFKELRTFQRAVFMIEVTAPLSKIHEAEYFLHESGYFVYNHMDFGLSYEAVRKKSTPGEPVPSGDLYISLRPQFAGIAAVATTGFGGDALFGLLFGYSVKNIISYLDMPDLSLEELDDYMTIIEEE